MSQNHELSRLRRSIDAVDLRLLDVLAEREKLVSQVLAIKQAQNLPARIPHRVAEVIDGMASEAARRGVDPDLARCVWTAMVEWFIAHEERNLNPPETV